MVNFDRPISTFSSRFKALSSARFGVKAMIAVGALALVTGLSTPAVAGTPTSHAPVVENVAMVSAAKARAEPCSSSLNERLKLVCCTASCERRGMTALPLKGSLNAM